LDILPFALAFGLVFGGVTMFVPLLIVDKGMSFGQAMVTSIKTLLPHWWSATLLWTLAQVTSIVGLFACLVGWLFTAPVQYMTESMLYLDFFGAERPPVQPPSAAT